MKTIEQLAQSTDPKIVRAFGAIRRFVITLTDSAIWQVAGVLMPDGREAMRAEVFGVVGVYARPPATVEAEAIAVMVAGATNPTIVGLRDEKTRAAVCGAMLADESALYNSQALVYVKADGTIEARSKTGTALALATKADLDAVVTYLRKQFSAAAGHIHATPSGPTTTITQGTTTADGSCPAATGTLKFRGE